MSAAGGGRAIFETAEQYRRLRMKLVVYFEGRRCWHAEDLADESIARLLSYVARAGFDGNADPLAFGIARNVLKEWLRKSGAYDETGDLDTLAAAPFPHPGAESRARAAAALAKLQPGDRELLEEYYVDGSTAEQLATRWSLSPAGIRTRIFRLRARLAKLLGPTGAAGGS